MRIRPTIIIVRFALVDETFFCTVNFNFYYYESSSSSSSSSSECPAQRQVLHCKRRNLGCSSAEGRSSTANARNQGFSFTRDLIGAVASRFSPHPTLCLASEETLKDLKRSQGHQQGGEETGFG